MKALLQFFHGLTLHFPAHGKGAVLVKRIGNKRQRRRMKFASPQAALEWCLENRAALVYEPFAHTKTLFSTAPGTSGILVKSDDFGRQRQRVKRFHDAFAALAWCVAKNSAFLYFPQAGNPADN